MTSKTPGTSFDTAEVALAWLRQQPQFTTSDFNGSLAGTPASLALGVIEQLQATVKEQGELIDQQVADLQDLRIRRNQLDRVISNTHTLYEDGDANLPSAILDRNGDVVLGQCKHCGAAEAELGERICHRRDPWHPEATLFAQGDLVEILHGKVVGSIEGYNVGSRRYEIHVDVEPDRLLKLSSGGEA